MAEDVSLSAMEEAMGSKGGPAYKTVPLRKEEISVGVIQQRLKAVDAKNPKPGMRANLDHMCWLLDQSQGWTGRKDLVVFHEFPVTGWAGTWDRKEALSISIELPGEETEVLAAKAKQYNCYIEFACYSKDKDWPTHFFNTGVIIGPNGDIVYKKWKLRNDVGLGFSTTVFDVLDEYVERYGWDAVLPVARLDIGNIAVMPEVWDPEIGRAFALKGAEIMIRYFTGAGEENFMNEFKSMCGTNKTYGVFVNNAVSPDNLYVEDVASGGCMIVDPRGYPIAQAGSHHECIVAGTIPMAKYRATHGLPAFPKELTEHVYKEYVSKWPPNTFSEGKPNNNAEGAVHYKKIVRW